MAVLQRLMTWPQSNHNTVTGSIDNFSLSGEFEENAWSVAR